MEFSNDGYKRSRQSGIFLAIAGVALGIWAGWGVLQNGAGMDTIGYALRFLGIAGAAFLLWTARDSRSITKNFSRYGELIVKQNVRSIGQLSQMMGVTPEIARQDVKSMIDQRVLVNAVLTDEGDIVDLFDTALEEDAGDDSEDGTDADPAADTDNPEDDTEKK